MQQLVMQNIQKYKFILFIMHVYIYYRQLVCAKAYPIIHHCFLIIVSVITQSNLYIQVCTYLVVHNCGSHNNYSCRHENHENNTYNYATNLTCNNKSTNKLPYDNFVHLEAHLTGYCE